MKIEEVAVMKVGPDDVIVIDSDKIAMPDDDAEWEAMHAEYRQAFPTNFLIFVPGGAEAFTVMSREVAVAALEDLAADQEGRTL